MNLGESAEHNSAVSGNSRYRRVAHRVRRIVQNISNHYCQLPVDHLREVSSHNWCGFGISDSAWCPESQRGTGAPGSLWLQPDWPQSDPWAFGCKEFFAIEGQLGATA